MKNLSRLQTLLFVRCLITVAICNKNLSGKRIISICESKAFVLASFITKLSLCLTECLLRKQNIVIAQSKSIPSRIRSWFLKYCAAKTMMSSGCSRKTSLAKPSNKFWKPGGTRSFMGAYCTAMFRFKYFVSKNQSEERYDQIQLTESNCANRATSELGRGLYDDSN